MADDTLSPVPYGRRIIKTNLGARDRFALASALAEVRKGTAPLPAAFTRHVLLLGLEQVGWTEERIIKEYAEFELKCLHDGTDNPYESE